jgi:hypothetical protein
MIVDRDVRGVVVAHHATRIRVPHAAVRQRLREALHEAVHLPAADLQLDRVAGVIGIVRDRRAIQMMNRVEPVVLVGELRSQTIDIAATPLEREIPEHMIKRAVLQHQHDDAVDLLQIREPTLLSHDKPR